MNILHYSLGFPPYRSGGMTKFCMDLIKQQIKDGNDVALLWPGQMGFVKKSMKIKYKGVVNIESFDIKSFEIINPLPVSFDEGIMDFDNFVSAGDRRQYLLFLKINNPDIIHVHTLMGLHKEFLEAAEELGIRRVFTAHDFFPICPKVTMFRQGGICKTALQCTDCYICNTTALDLKKIKLLQSPVYRYIKDFSVIKKIRKQHRDNYLGGRNAEYKGVYVKSPEKFKKLRKYYESMLMLMDIIHYNSTVTRNVYQSFFSSLNGCVISISHSDIGNHKKIKDYKQNIIRMRYLGPQGEAKGYFYLKTVLDKVWNERKDFRLDVHFRPTDMTSYINCNEKYKYSELEKIFDETDVLITPSIWYETFGYTVLEALSYGVPVIITNNVGAKDILIPGAGIVVNNTKNEELYNVFMSLAVDDLKNMNMEIVNRQPIITLQDMSDTIYKKCYQKSKKQVW